jgi:spermidine synthase
MNLKTFVLFLITFFVAFCTIIYELVYSQLLTIVFGGTVLRYSITIGLFLFSLGVGSFLYNYLEKYDKQKLFVFIEICLSLVGFLGVVFIILFNSYFGFLPHLLKVCVSNIPVVLVGILSGLDLPLLSFFVGEKSSAYSQVLGVDYFGSLAGTFLYSLVFYPHQGLIFSGFIVAFFNLLMALLFFIAFMKKEKKFLFYLFFVLLISFFIVLFNIAPVSDSLMKVYLTESLEKSYFIEGLEKAVVNIKEIFFTPYQMAFIYSVVLNKGTEFEIHNNCLNLDEHVQICDSWVKEYHQGLVDVPLSFFENISSNTKVLLIGGGDGIATNYLRKYNVSVDQVDIDEEFVEYSKKNDFISQYSNDSWNYSLLNLTIDDAFSYLKYNKNKYDLILLDLPGLKEDKLLPLYSREFFLSLNKSLSQKGVLVMWVYPFDTHKNYSEVLLNTLSVSGFNYFFYYQSYILPGGDEGYDVEDYILISREDSRRMNFSKNNYVSNLSGIYNKIEWQKINFSEGGQINSIFKPTYRMIIKDGQ